MDRWDRPYRRFFNDLAYAGPQQGAPKMERTKFFAVKLSPAHVQDDSGLRLDNIGRSIGDFHTADQTTPLRDTRHEVRVDVAKLIKEDERFLVVQTVCLLEGEEPQPPIRVTEYK